MERLTFEGNFCDIAMCRENPCPYNGSCTQREVWERLKAYEDAKEQRRIIMPPCKVGDTVWSRDVEPWTVISIEWFSRKVTHLHCVSPVTGQKHTLSIGKRSLGKTVFLTREEAEAAVEFATDTNVGNKKEGDSR